MTTDRPDNARLLLAMSATWPPAAVIRAGSFLVREGRGGGSRVSAALALGAWQEAEIAAVEDAMRALGQSRLFQIRPEESALDSFLEQRGYVVLDPVHLLVGSLQELATGQDPVVEAVWPPVAAQEEIWAKGGIGPARLAVMERVAGPRSSFLGRVGGTPAGTGFVAVDGDVAVLHALEVAPEWRRQGLAARMMPVMAAWAQEQGARWFALAVTRANQGANALYARLGLVPGGAYHYRLHPQP